MDPTREPRSTPAEPTAPRDILSDDAVVAYLRARAPGLPTARFDARAVISRARGALRRAPSSAPELRVAVAGAATAYLVLALARARGPLPVPGLGPVSVPGGDAVRACVAGLFPGASRTRPVAGGR